MRFILCVILASASLHAAVAAYLAPGQAGFADCMLIYERQTRPVEDLLPYVAHLTPDGEPDAWLFDSFLFLRYSAGPSGASFYDGPTDRADWEFSLDTWFEPGRDLDALQQAVDQAKADLGPPPKPVQVVISIHYPHPGQEAFGDVDGDGTPEDLSDPDGREGVVAWYVDEVVKRFEDAAFADLELWGLYWMNEGITPADTDIVQRTSRLLHDRGLRFLWIPYFRAPGFERWEELGFDVAILQPNYAFLSQHEGLIRNDRLIETALLAQQYGMGVEMEVGYSPETNLREREIFRDYMAFGADGLSGYQGAVKAYFQSLEVFVQLWRAEDPDARAVYDEIARFVQGEAIPRPGSLVGAEVIVEPPVGAEASLLTDGLFSAAAVAEAGCVFVGDSASIDISLPREGPIAEGELVCLTAQDEAWSGVVSAEVRQVGGEGWEPTGWIRATVPKRRDAAGLHRVLAVPVGREDVEAVRLAIRPDDPSVPLRIDELSITRAGVPAPRERSNLALAMPYTVRPDAPRAYPDRGGQLTDGLVSTEGFPQGRSVGWYGRDAVVCLDLGRIAPIDRVDLHCDGGGYGAVHFPVSVTAEFTRTGPPAFRRDRGFGPPPPAPEAIALVDGTDTVIVAEREVPDGRTNAQGVLSITPRIAPVEARFVTLRVASNVWLMLSEIEVWSGGDNIGLGGRYVTFPRPSKSGDTPYADDGGMLTDGHIASGFEARRVVGWSGGDTPQIDLDLLSAQPISRVELYTLGGGLYGIVAPPAAELSISEDGGTYRTIGVAELTDPGGDASVPMVLTWQLPAPTPARHLRLILTPSPGWTMVSEVMVE